MTPTRTVAALLAATLTACAAPTVKRTYTTTDPDVPMVQISAERQPARSYTADGAPVVYTPAQIRAASRPELTPEEARALRIFAWCGALDAASTLVALHHGAQELNPLLGSHPSAATLAASKGVLYLGARALIVRGDGTWAPTVRAVGWAQCIAGAWNLAIAGGVL